MKVSESKQAIRDGIAMVNQLAESMERDEPADPRFVHIITHRAPSKTTKAYWIRQGIKIGIDGEVIK